MKIRDRDYSSDDEEEYGARDLESDPRKLLLLLQSLSPQVLLLLVQLLILKLNLLLLQVKQRMDLRGGESRTKPFTK
jgi:hypothetical protein